ncbi:hypothetical protein ALP61_04372, partial [Pseudomonas savastanoi]
FQSFPSADDQKENSSRPDALPESRQEPPVAFKTHTLHNNSTKTSFVMS